MIRMMCWRYVAPLKTLWQRLDVGNVEKVDDPSKLQAVQHIMATLFSAQNALRALAPEFRWAGLGNLLGDYGEYVAIKHYGLTKAPAGANGYDAITPTGQKVQIKANHSASTIGFRGEADLLLVIKIEPDGQWTETYYGPFAAVKALARYSARDNKHMVAVKHLAGITTTPTGLDAPIVPDAEIDALFE